MPSKSLSQTRKLQAKATPPKISHKIAKIPIQEKKKKAKSQLVPHSHSNNQLGLFKENSLFDNFFKDSIFSKDMVSLFEPFNDFPLKPFDNFFEDMSNMSQDFEEEFDEIEEMMENPPVLEDPEHTSCYVKMMKNDNGHVQVKAMKKVPGEEWESVKHEYYEKKRPALKALKDKKRDLVTIEDETEY